MTPDSILVLACGCKCCRFLVGCETPMSLYPPTNCMVAMDGNGSRQQSTGTTRRCEAARRPVHLGGGTHPPGFVAATQSIRKKPLPDAVA